MARLRPTGLPGSSASASGSLTSLAGSEASLCASAATTVPLLGSASGALNVRVSRGVAPASPTWTGRAGEGEGEGVPARRCRAALRRVATIYVRFTSIVLYSTH